MKISRKNLVVALVATTLCSSVLATTQSFKVNGQLITRAQQENLIKAYTDRGQLRTPQLENQVRLLLTRDALLLQEAKKANLANSPEVKHAIEQATKNILMTAVVSDWVAKNPVSESDVHKLFDLEKKRWGDIEVSVRHILVKDEVTAKKLLEAVKKGENFDKLARKHSGDTSQNKAAGGLIEWNSPNMFDKEFADSFAKLKPGEVAEKPVRTHLGWHVVKLEGRRPALRWQNYEQSAPMLRELLTQQRIQTYVDSLMKEAKITDEVTKSSK